MRMKRGLAMGMTYEKARAFIYRNARPIDLARWQYHFENGSKEAVVKALSHYQNEDGGFGHALEADAWNPYSSPIQTWAATEILREIDFTDNAHPVVKGILLYLASGKDFEGHLWYNTVKSNNDYPHAPWWHTDSDSTCHHDYNPTACLAGFIVRFADRQSKLYALGCRIAAEAVEQLMGAQRENDMHTLSCYIRLMMYCEEAGVTDLFDISALKEKIGGQVHAGITQNTAEWETSYVCKPSQFFNSKNSPFYSGNERIADYECEYIIRSQLADGSFHIPWRWNDYADEWAISKNWWKAHVILSNLLYLKGFGRL